MARIRSVLVLALALPADATADAIEMPTVLSPGLVKRCASVERTLAKIGKYERIVRVEKERGREAKAKSKKAEKRLTKLNKRRQKLARKGGTDAICAWIAEGEYTVEDARQKDKDSKGSRKKSITHGSL